MRQFRPGDPVILYGTEVSGTILFGVVKDCEPYFVDGRQEFDLTIDLENGQTVNSCGLKCTITSVEHYASLLEIFIDDLQERLLKCKLVLRMGKAGANS